MASQDWFEKDFYKTLGVSPDADDAEIKKAYRKLARANHPDQHPGDEAAEQRFKEIGEAYQVLSDAEDRQQYDAIRQDIDWVTFLDSDRTQRPYLRMEGTAVFLTGNTEFVPV